MVDATTPGKAKQSHQSTGGLEGSHVDPKFQGHGKRESLDMTWMGRDGRDGISLGVEMDTSFRTS